jgi:GNAT superfamily N-acetyltransferase
VIPEYQRRGIGSLLLKEVIDIADAQDQPTAIYLESAPEAKTFYPKLGFEFANPVPDSEDPIPLEELPKEMVRRGTKKGKEDSLNRRENA